MTPTRFKLGDVVHLAGIAGRVLGDEMVVVEVLPNKDAAEWMDQYTVRATGGYSGTYYSAELDAASHPAPRLGRWIKL
jgi:hypothetical protein